MIGGAVLDRKYHARGPLVAGTSNPADGSHSHGGVARNVAENLARLGVPVFFSSIVGADDTGSALLNHLEGLGVDTGGVERTPERPTAEYAAILDTRNELALGIADMAIFDLYTERQLDAAWPRIAAASWVFADCNLVQPVLDALISRCRAAARPLAANTVSSPKATKLAGRLDGVGLLFTNCDEAAALTGGAGAAGALAAAEALAGGGLLSGIVTEGAAGYAVLDNGAASRHAAIPATPVDITGAGDAFVAGTLCRLLAGDGLAQAARAGALLAARTTETDASVLPDLSPAFFAAPDRAAPMQG